MRLLAGIVFAVITSLAPAPVVYAAEPYDLNADGRQELVMGLQDWAPGGAAMILPAGDAGLSMQPHLLGPLPAAVSPENGSSFGSSVASADFDGDGHADLAIGDTSAYSTETDDREVTLGAVTVRYGSPAGLDDRMREFRGRRLPVTYSATYLGWALAGSDLNGDGFGDVVAGMPGDDPIDDGEGGEGAIQLLFGSPAGLSEAGSIRLRPRRIGEGMFSGSVLAVGDFDRDGHPDVLTGERGAESNSDGDGRPGMSPTALARRSAHVAATPCRGSSAAASGRRRWRSVT